MHAFQFYDPTVDAWRPLTGVDSLEQATEQLKLLVTAGLLWQKTGQFTVLIRQVEDSGELIGLKEFRFLIESEPRE